MATNRELEIKKSITDKLSRNFGTTPELALDDQMYNATLLTIRDILMQKNAEFEQEVKNKSAKRIYYMCMEFLIGPSLRNNLLNLGLYNDYNRVLKSFGFSLENFIKHEDDPGLGNGGLGRLAACFMDGLTSQDYPAYGYSICYDFGLFKQKIVDGEQFELPDVWLPSGESWLVRRSDLAYTVKFGGTVKEYWHNGKMLVDHVDCEEVRAVPYDMMISGADSKAVNILRLWKAQDISKFDMKLFSQGQYVRALEENTNAEVISKVLYPSDNHYEGKQLRLTQQYVLVSASLQCILNEHLSQYHTLDNLAEKVAIHINDTHPALCVPELMRILLDECAYDWDTAWDIVTKTVSYTNHTVMPEALETWGEGIFKLRLPRIYGIICEINRRFCEDVWNNHPEMRQFVDNMSIIGNNQVRMANL
ncbi:MAG: glycogen/starch/alpha-glucan phosphorylase, partial [Clostridia bacterium]|nr:glycogen/starch/alpha-glucan phosphorylase [Clostridia bacterium]